MTDDPITAAVKYRGSGEDNAERAALPFIDYSRWDEEPTPDRDWAVQDRIPLRQTALFTGEGGSGKSSITLHQCCAHVLGRDWLGSLPEIGPAIFIDAEDDANEIHIRLSCIARHYDVAYQEIREARLYLIHSSAGTRSSPQSAVTVRSNRQRSMVRFYKRPGILNRK
jgi:RecA-family ATPase